MPFDGEMPDRSVPTLENLAFLLRNPETWPYAFEWDYSRMDRCALGLARAVWGKSAFIPREISWRVHEQLPGYFPAVSAFDIIEQMRRVQPEQVADAIDRYLMQQSDRHMLSGLDPVRPEVGVPDQRVRNFVLQPARDDVIGLGQAIGEGKTCLFEQLRSGLLDEDELPGLLGRDGEESLPEIIVRGHVQIVLRVRQSDSGHGNHAMGVQASAQSRDARVLTDLTRADVGSG